MDKKFMKKAVLILIGSIATSRCAEMAVKKLTNSDAITLAAGLATYLVAYNVSSKEFLDIDLWATKI